MNSKVAAFVVLGVIFLLAGVFNMAFEKMKSLDVNMYSSDLLSGLFSRITGFIAGVTRTATSEIEANLTLSSEFPQDFYDIKANSLKVTTCSRVSSIQIKPVVGSPYTLELMPSTSVDFEGYMGNLIIDDGLEIDGRASSIQSKEIELKAENSVLRVSSTPIKFRNLILNNVSIDSLELVNVKGSITIREGKDSIIHIISQSRNIVLRNFVGDVIINGNKIFIKGRASYNPAALFSPPINLPVK